MLRQPQGNFIGTNPNLDLGLGNQRNGVLFTGGAHDNTVGSLLTLANNTIANNTANGVRVDSGNRNAILGNSFFNTTLDPISLAPGANANVQRPRVDVAYQDDLNGITVEGRVFGTPGATYEVQIYFDHFGGLGGEGRYNEVIDTFSVTLGPSGQATYREHLNWIQVDPNGLVRATVTCDNNTSELSPPIHLSRLEEVNLVLDATASDPVGKGSDVVLIINVNNLGPANAANATTEAQIPPGWVFVSANNPAGTFSTSGRTVVFNNSLNKGQSANMTTTFRAPTASGNYPIYVRTFSPSQNDGDTRDNFSTPEVFVLLGSNPTDVEVRFTSAPAAVDARQTYTVEMEVRNNGPNAATGVLVTGEAGGNLNQILTSLGTPTIIGHLFSIDLGTLLPGTVVPVALLMTSQDAGDLDSFTAIARSTTDDFYPGNNVTSAQVNVRPPRLVSVPPGPSDPVDALILQWPDSSGWVLEQASTLGTPPPWTPVPESQIQTVPPNRRHVTTHGGIERFFQSRRRGPPNPFCKLHQVAMVGDDFVYLQSGVGLAEVTFNGATQPQYFNLSVNSSWVVQNIPVLNRMGADVAQTVHFHFPLGPFGEPVSEVNGGFSLTPDPLGAQPPSNSTFPVAPFLEKLFTGQKDENLEFGPPSNLVGGTVVRQSTGLASFPNREQGNNECAPGAILNSLNFLNEHFSLFIDPAELSMDKIKAAIGWDPDGAPVGDDPKNAIWVQKKQQYMAAKRFPIVTTVTENPQEAMNALSNRCDVEIRMTGHVAAVVGMTDLGNNRYSVDLAHDLRQGEKGGNFVETIVLDLNKNKQKLFFRMDGSNWSPDFRVFVIECPSF